VTLGQKKKDQLITFEKGEEGRRQHQFSLGISHGRGALLKGKGEKKPRGDSQNSISEKGKKGFSN